MHLQYDQIEHVLDTFQFDLKGISFLPRHDYGAFPQMPWEAITEAEYLTMVASHRPLDLSDVEDAHEVTEKFCDGEACEITFTAVDPE